MKLGFLSDKFSWGNNMKETFKALIAVMLFEGLTTNVSASGIIMDVSASDPGLGIFSLRTIDSTPNGYGLVWASENFATNNPITLTFNVEHSDDDRNPYDIEMPIANVTLLAFSNFHLHISGPTPSGVVFSSFDAVNEEFGPDFSPYFTLDLPSKAKYSLLLLNKPAPKILISQDIYQG